MKRPEILPRRGLRRSRIDVLIIVTHEGSAQRYRRRAAVRARLCGYGHSPAPDDDGASATHNREKKSIFLLYTCVHDRGGTHKYATTSFL